MAAQEEPRTFEVSLTLKAGYEFTVNYGHPGIGDLVVDEYPPIGRGRGPNPARMLATAVGHCLASSLLFCLRKARIDVSRLQVRVSGTMARNQRGRLRIVQLRVQLAPEMQAEARERLGPCLETFEDFCIVTGSVRQGLDVEVSVAPEP